MNHPFRMSHQKKKKIKIKKKIHVNLSAFHLFELGFRIFYLIIQGHVIIFLNKKLFKWQLIRLTNDK
jgi:hypothetical protein